MMGLSRKAWGSLLLSAALAVGLLQPFNAVANDLPDADQSTTVGPIVDPTFGFWTAFKSVQIWNPGNVSNPCPDITKFCYVYTLSNDPSSSVALVGFGVQVPAGTALAVQGAGYIPGSGVVPDSTNVLANEVRWEFGTNVIPPGSTSEHLYINSTYGPGTVKVTINGDGGLDAGDLDCLGPVVPPNQAGNPISCTIGFWKERSVGKDGLLKFFPGSISTSGVCGSPTEDLCKVITRAVVIASPIFGTAANDAAVTNAMRAALLTALQSKGNRTTLQRAQQQIAAFALNLAGGAIFPSNVRCAFFCSNTISATTYPDVPLNADPSGDPTKLTICDALAYIKSIIGTNPNRAQQIADDLNNGIGVDNVTIN